MPDGKPSGHPAPPPDRWANGSYATGALRIRTGWFGFSIVEEQIEDVFGSRFWRRIQFPKLIAEVKYVP